MNREKARQVKFLSCILLDDVLCSYRKTKDFRIMERCFTCQHYTRFLREMQEGEDKTFEEIDRIRKYGYPKDFTESDNGE